MLKLYSRKCIANFYVLCLISLVTGYTIGKVLDVHTRHDSDPLDPEDQRNLSDPGWKHPNWKEICRLQDSRFILRPRFTIPRTKSRMPIPPKCGIRDPYPKVTLRSICQKNEDNKGNQTCLIFDNINLKSLYKDEEDVIVIQNDEVASWDKFETLDELYAAAMDDPLTLSSVNRLYPTMTETSLSDTSLHTFKKRRSLDVRGEKFPRIKSIAKDMEHGRLDYGKVDDIISRILNGQETDDLINEDKRSFGFTNEDAVDTNADNKEFDDFEMGDSERRSFNRHDRTGDVTDEEEAEDRQERVIGGEEVDEHEWPWLVAIGPRDFGQICGGTLVSARWVLTAAHCFPQRLNPCDYVVRLGEHDLSTDEEKHIDIIPSRIIVHEDFSFFTDGDPSNDIALIQLSKPVKYTAKVNGACLPDLFEFPRPGTKCTLVGWGFLEALNFNQLPNKPHGVEFETFSRSTCTEIWGDIITKSMFCAGDLRGGKDACAGDSGGPLVCQNGIGKYELVGIVSFGRDMCGEAGFGGVYTLVSRYIGWIERMVKQVRKEDLYDARWWAELADDNLANMADPNQDTNSLFTDLFHELETK